jgi:hypothetical protein
LHFNRLTLIDPTIKQSALLAGVSIPYVAAAIAFDEHVFRKAVLQQRASLLAAAHAVNTAVNRLTVLPSSPALPVQDALANPFNWRDYLAVHAKFLADLVSLTRKDAAASAARLDAATAAESGGAS